MFNNEHELYQIAKLRQEETERIARNAWKHRHAKQQSVLQKMFEKWSNREKSVTVQQNCGCACQS